MSVNLATAPGLVEQWLHATLTGDATLSALVGGRIYSTAAPQGATFPLLLFAHLSGVDLNQLGPYRTLSTLRYKVAAVVDQPTIVALDAIMARADALLFTGVPVTLAHGYMLSSVRVVPPQILGVPDSGINFRQMVAQYEIQAQEGLGG